ncbi:hypothetical protein KAZ93_03795 [Patescibacteria group bacterium]|nr:hypothetical protein [Patescibacteria group bacterium]
MAFKELQQAQNAAEAQKALRTKTDRINLMNEVVAISEETEKTDLMHKIAGFLIELKPEVESVFAKSYTDTMTSTERATAGLTRAWEKLSEQNPEPSSTITTKGNFDKVKQE